MHTTPTTGTSDVRARRLLVLVNPRSHGGRQGTFIGEGVEALREQGHHVVVRPTGKPGEARELVTRHAARFDRVVICGGDGSVNEAAAGLAASGADCALSIVPMGTGNDFAKAALGPIGEVAALALAGCGAAAAIDVGLAGRRPFVNAVTAGGPAEISRRVNPILKATLGRLAYVAAGLANPHLMTPFEGRLEAPEGLWTGQILLFVVANGQSIGGGSMVAPDARVDDGLLDVVVLPALKGTALVGAMRALRGGGQHPALVRMRVDRLKFSGDREIPINCDGETEAAREVEFRVMPGALRLVVHGPGPARGGFHVRSEPDRIAL